MVITASYAQSTSYARVYTKINSKEMKKILDSMEIDYKQTTNATKKIIFKLRLANLNVNLRLLDCSSNQCESLQLYAGFSTRINVTPKQINEWNRKRRFTRAYLNPSQQPSIETDLSLKGGKTRANIKFFISHFRELVSKFAEHINY